MRFVWENVTEGRFLRWSMDTFRGGACAVRTAQAPPPPPPRPCSHTCTLLLPLLLAALRAFLLLLAQQPAAAVASLLLFVVPSLITKLMSSFFSIRPPTAGLLISDWTKFDFVTQAQGVFGTKKPVFNPGLAGGFRCVPKEHHGLHK